jgi:eukaryotic-like serine/threonine-protein kinase
LSAPQSELFDGTERFRILRRLGVGGMGVVYEAFDNERQTRVALKTLRLLEPHLLLRFKQEFRALQGLDHPNLVSLLELVNDRGRWFFTMELVEGVDFLAWVRGEHAPKADSESTGLSFTDRASTPDTVVDYRRRPTPPTESLNRPEPLAETAEVELPPERPPPRAPIPFDEARLRSALAQLGAGLARLHRAGKVHRDIKPSNILVRHDGQLVILDFGLVAELDRDRMSESNIVGTVEYMAPEQAAGRAVGPAADWYSVGVLLYEALTARTPFAGHSLAVMQDKQLKVPTRPQKISGCAEDLDRLCMELLAIVPSERPSEAEILARLGAEAQPLVPQSTPHRQSFVGRAKELDVLWSALEEVRRGQQAIVLIDGPSGVGKSALVRHFTRRMAAMANDVVVVNGRYYEREAVPYRAMDTMMDEVSHYLMRLGPDAAEAILPLDTGVLAQQFPSLRGVEAVSRGAFRAVPLDPKEMRVRLFAAVRELVIRLSRKSRLVLVIDDVQWADSDSRAAFLAALRPPEGPALLAIATHRTSEDDPMSSRMVREFLSRIGPLRHMVLEPLPPEDARELAARLIGRATNVDARALADEAEGHPLFIDALVRHALARGSHAVGTIRLDDALAARIDELPPDARHLLELVALNGGPLGNDQSLRASGLDAPEQSRAIGALRVQHLVRLTRSREEDALEPYHDRVRELTAARLDEPTKKRRHEELARALEASGHADPEALFTHYRGAGRNDRALPFGAQAAARASEALAFDLAARLYRESIALCTEPAELRRLHVLYGEALANAGRGPEAAEAFRAALPGAPREESLELKRRVAEQLLRSGRIDPGMQAVREVLDAVGLTLPRTPRRALVSLLWNRARLRLRGLSFHERAPSEVPAALLTRIDICWSMAGVLAMVDTIRGANFQTIHLRLALKAGDPHRVARALALEGAFSSASGGATAKRTAQICADAEKMAQRLGDPYSIGWTRGTAGVAAALEGRWEEGMQLTHEGEQILRTRCGNIAWELSSFQFFHIYSLAFLGKTRELCARVPESLRHAEERGDLYGAAANRLALANLVWLCADDPDEARRQVAQAIAQWSRNFFQVEHFWELLAEGQADLYLGDGAAAWKRVSAAWPALSSSLLLRVQLTRIEGWQLRARAALAAALKLTGDERAELLASAQKDARKILGEKMAWSTPLGHLIEAGLAAVENNPSRAIAALERAIPLLEAAHMALYAHAARRQLGRLRHDDDLVAAADFAMVEEAIVKPERMADMLVPGLDPATR